MQRNIKMLNPIDVRCFNPSVEGQPLQPQRYQSNKDVYISFNPSVEGQPLQLVILGLNLKSKGRGFNPSVEGQPLQLAKTFANKYKVQSKFQSLCRGTAFATESLRRPWVPMDTTGCFSNLWLVFVF